jgi:hypothetical protein
MKGIDQRLGRAGTVRAAAVVAFAALVVGVPFAGCKSGSGPASSGQATGLVSLALELAPGVSISSVSWVITGPGGFTRTGSIDVSSSQTISALISGIPAGTGYQITATANDGTTTCLGQAMFDIMAGATSRASLHLTCNTPGRTGSVLVNGTINVCPTIDGLSASPLEVLEGGHIHLAATAHDADAAPSPLTFDWEGGAGVGRFTAPTATSTDFVCASAGTAVLTLTISDGDTACANSVAISASVTVTCDSRVGSAAAEALVLHAATVASGTIDASFAPRGLTPASFTIQEVLDESAIALDDLVENGGQAAPEASGRRLVTAAATGYSAAVFLRQNSAGFRLSEIQGNQLASEIATTLASLRATRNIDAGSLYVLQIPALHVTMIGHREATAPMLTALESRGDLPLTAGVALPAVQMLANLALPAQRWAIEAKNMAANGP